MLTLEQLFRLTRLAHNVEDGERVMAVISDPQGPTRSNPSYPIFSWRVSLRVRLEGDLTLADGQGDDPARALADVATKLRQQLTVEADKHARTATSARARLERFDRLLAAGYAVAPYAPTERAPADSVPPSGKDNDQ